MNQTMPPHLPGDRSVVTSEFRVNPFRVLRLPTTAGPDEAVWRAEELLALGRAGVPAEEPDPLPWLPPPDEDEVRQAVQAAEEPMRRLLARLSWFDFINDPAGELLRRAVATLDPTAVVAYRESPRPDDPLLPEPVSSAEEPIQAPKSVAEESEDAAYALMMGEKPTPAAVLPAPLPLSTEPVLPSQDFRGTIRRINEANLLLLLASRVFQQSPTAELLLEEPVWQGTGRNSVIVNPHSQHAKKQAVAETAQVSRLWWGDEQQPGAIQLWMDRLKSRSFAAYVQSCLTELGDEIIGPDDTEIVISSVWTRLTDLLSGEVKAHLENGHTDRAAALLTVAGRTGIEQRRWTVGLRGLRPRFKAEVAELETLLGPAPYRLDDVDLYLDRVNTLNRRWSALDPAGLLGLREQIDAGLAKLIENLSSRREIGTLPRVLALLRKAGGEAGAESLKQRAVAAAERADEYRQFGCFFCQKRDAEHKCSVALRGSKVTHVTYEGSTRVNHTLISYGLLPRCKACGEYHSFLHTITAWVMVATFPIAVMLAYLIAAPIFSSMPSGKGNGGEFIFLLGLAVIGLSGLAWWGVGVGIRMWVGQLTLPAGNTLPWDVELSPAYRKLTREDYSVSIDYSRGALARAEKESSKLPTRY